ncbi:hypothetical protein LIER_08471 [Lithospermum erythrorhizon]|uniref:Uncharacterized protein n=1 Tax=Lithospermum erythrorhizon TaxID=34254 RepID=A0AAV3PC81_LITER
METNLSSHPGVRARAQSTLGCIEDKGRSIAATNPSKKNPKLPRIDQVKEARVDTQVPRPTREQVNIDTMRVTSGDCRSDAVIGKSKVYNDHHLRDNESSNNNYAPQKQQGTTQHQSNDRASSDSHRRRSNHRSSYDLITSDSTP